MQRERGETQKKEFDELMGQKQIKIRHTYRDRNMQLDNTDKAQKKLFCYISPPETSFVC